MSLCVSRSLTIHVFSGYVLYLFPAGGSFSCQVVKFLTKMPILIHKKKMAVGGGSVETLKQPRLVIGLKVTLKIGSRTPLLRTASTQLIEDREVEGCRLGASILCSSLLGMRRYAQATESETWTPVHPQNHLTYNLFSQKAVMAQWRHRTPVWLHLKPTAWEVAHGLLCLDGLELETGQPRGLD